MTAKVEKIRPEPTTLPDPKGFKILVAMPEPEDETKGGIIKPDSVKDIERSSSVVGYVIKMGSLCYRDKERFPLGPWCTEGELILLGAFKGTRLKIHGKEFRIINDDQVLATVEDPRGYERM